MVDITTTMTVITEMVRGRMKAVPLYAIVGKITVNSSATPRRAACNIYKPFRYNQVGWETRVPPVRPQRVQDETSCREQKPGL